MQDEMSGVLATARQALRQGRLSEAMESISSADSPSLSADLQFQLEILRGNIWYERSEFQRAREHYARASTLLESAGVRETGQAVVAANLELAEIAFSRQTQRKQELDQLHDLLAITLLAGLLACIAVLRASRRASRNRG